MTNEIAGLVLAAGQASRYGALKQLVPIDGRPMVVGAVDRLRAAGAGRVVVVVGYRGEEVRDCLGGIDGIHCVHNPEWQSGLASSLQAGLRAMESSVGRVLVQLADTPWVPVAHLQAMLDASGRYPVTVVGTRYAGSVGVPAIFPRNTWPELMSVNGDQGAREVLRRLPTISLDCPQAGWDVDTVDDLARGSGRT